MTSLFRVCLRPRSAWFALLSLVLALPPLTRAAAADWIKLETGEFVIYSDAAERQVVESALRYAAFRRAFGELFLAPGQTLPPSTLLLFKKYKSFRSVTPAAPTEGNMKTVNFSCEVDGTPLSTFALDGDRDRALALTFEFETIWALRRIGYFVPVWMSQGAGSVLATVTYEKGTCLVGDPDRRSFKESFDWPRFFEINETSPLYREAATELARFQNQSWGLLHWILFADTDSRARFAALAQGLRTRPALAVVTDVMHTPEAQLTKAIWRHPKKPRAIPFDEAALRASFRLTPAPEAEVLAQTANLLIATGRTAEGDAQLDQAQTLAPGLPAVKEALARRQLRDSRPREAIQLYRDAIAAGSTDFVAYLQSATQRLDDNRTNGADRPGEGGPEALKALAELRRALQLNPGCLPCYHALGRALYVAPQPDPAGIDELSAAVGPGSDGAIVRFYRALLYSRLGRRADCVRDFRANLADSTISDHLRASTRSQYLQETVATDAKRIDKCVRAGDYPAAYAILAAGEQDDEPEVHENYTRLRAWLKKAVQRDDSATPADRKLAGLE